MIKWLIHLLLRRISFRTLIVLIGAILSTYYSWNYEGTFPPQATVQAQTLIGRVVRVADGDTVTILGPQNEEIRVRFQGIDAPERSQPFGSRSGKYLRSLVYGKTIRVEVDKMDRHGRTVGRVWLDDPQTGKALDVEETMLKAGLAWHYSYFNHERKLEQAQQSAKKEKLGIWSQPDPTPPWKWRQQNR